MDVFKKYISINELCLLQRAGMKQLNITDLLMCVLSYSLKISLIVLSLKAECP